MSPNLCSSLGPLGFLLNQIESLEETAGQCFTATICISCIRRSDSSECCDGSFPIYTGGTFSQGDAGFKHNIPKYILYLENTVLSQNES